MAYKYYREYINEEHMLFAYEIAAIYNLGPHDRATENLIHKIIKEHIKNNNVLFNPIYYQVSKGLKKVYPESIWRPAIENYINNN